MPYKTGKLKGQLTTAEIRKLIRGHNILTSIKIPKGADRDDIIKIIENKGYSVNHEKKSLDPKGGISKGRPKVKLQKAQELTKSKPKTELQKQKATESKAQKEAKRKKEEREIRKKAVQEEKARSKPKPKAKTTTIETQTEKPKPKKEPKKEPKKKVLAIQDKDDFGQEVKENRCGKAVAHAESIIRLYEEYNGVFKDFPDYKTKKEMMEDLKELKEENWGDCTQSEQAKIKKAIKVHEENQKKPKGKVKAAVEKIEKKSDKGFKVERRERTQKINQLSQEIGKKFNPFKILGITASQETPELVKSRCRELRLKEHPDKGGDPEKFDLIQKACKILLDTQTITKKNDKEKGEAVKKPDEKNTDTFKMKDKEYDFTSFVEWAKNQGYKWSNTQLKDFNEMLNNKNRKVVSVRTYNKSNGVLVIVPTFKIIDKEGKEKEAELTNLTTQSIYKTELKPSEKKEYTPEEKKAFIKSQILFFKKDTAELERLKKSDEKLEDDEHKKIKSMEQGTPNFGFYIVRMSEPSIYQENLSQKQKDYIKSNMDLYKMMSERNKIWRNRIKSNTNIIKRLEKQL